MALISLPCETADMWNLDHCKAETYDSDGFAEWLVPAYSFYMWLMEQHPLIQAFIFVPILSCLLMAVLLDNVTVLITESYWLVQIVLVLCCSAVYYAYFRHAGPLHGVERKTE